MKKIILFCLLISMMLCLFSCTKDDIDTTNATPQEDTQQPSQTPVEDSVEKENSDNTTSQEPDQPTLEDGGIYDDGSEWKPVK